MMSVKMRSYLEFLIFLYYTMTRSNFVFTQSLDYNEKNCNFLQLDRLEQQVDNMVSVIRTQVEEIHQLKDRVTKLEQDIKVMRDEKVNESQAHAPINESSQDKYTEQLNGTGQFGTEFLLTFPPVIGKIARIQLLVVSLRQTVVQITSEEIGINDTVIVSNKRGLRMDLPNSLEQGGSYLGHNIVAVTSDSPITVHVVQFSNSGAGDGYIAVPKSRMKTRYYFSNNKKAFISIAALSDIQLKVKVLEGPYSSFIYNSTNVGKVVPFNITVLKGQMLQLISYQHAMGEVSGSGPFTALTGSYFDTSLYLLGHSASYVESLTGTDNKLFIVPNLSNTTSKYLFCNSNTSISATSTEPVFKRDSYVLIERFNHAASIKTNTSSYCQYIGHGLSLSIPGISDYGSYFRYITPSVASYDHHAAVIIESKYKSGLSLSNIDPEEEIALNRTEVTSLDGRIYDVLYYNIGPGHYEISHHNRTVRFMVLAYGFGINVNASYGFPVGFA